MKKLLYVLFGTLMLTGAGCSWFGGEAVKPKTFDELEREKMVSYNDYFLVAVQTPSQTVKIEETKFSKPGFMLIFEVKADGSRGTMLGYSNIVPQGITQNVKIALTTKLDATKQYLAAMYDDSDGDTKFAANKDLQLKTSESALLEKKFAVVGE